MDNQHRFIANDGDYSTLQLLGSTVEEQIGKVGVVIPECSPGEKGQRRNLFYFENSSKL